MWFLRCALLLLLLVAQRALSCFSTTHKRRGKQSHTRVENFVKKAEEEEEEEEEREAKKKKKFNISSTSKSAPFSLWRAQITSSSSSE